MPMPIAMPIAMAFSGVLAFWPPSPPQMASVLVAPAGAIFSDWGGVAVAVEGGVERAEPDCQWWNGTFTFQSTACSAFAITRIGAADASTAIDRATRCAATGTTSCVLSGEIGFSVPAVFLYDEEQAAMKMLIAPRLLSQTNPGPVKTIKLVDPLGTAPSQLFEFNSTLEVEFLVGGSRRMDTLTLTGQDSYCIQALRRSIESECWAELD